MSTLQRRKAAPPAAQRCTRTGQLPAPLVLPNLALLRRTRPLPVADADDPFVKPVDCDRVALGGGRVDVLVAYPFGGVL